MRVKIFRVDQNQRKKNEDELPSAFYSLKESKGWHKKFYLHESEWQTTLMCNNNILSSQTGPIKIES